MSDINSSLIGFLKKKSLFSDSPSKSFKFRQRSKQKKNLIQSQSSKKHMVESGLKQNSIKSSANMHRYKQKHNTQVQQSQQGDQTVEIERKIIFNNSFQDNKINKTTVVSPRRNFNVRGVASQNQSYWQSKQQQNTNLWTGLVNHSNSFQSARLQSVQCLESMSIKLQAQLSNIDYKIQTFHNKMTEILNKQFMNMKQRIYSIVNKVFEESENLIRSYVKQQQQILAYQLLMIKQNLQNQYEKVQSMKDQINKPNWKRVTGELLSSQLQQKVENMLRKSRSVNIAKWEVGDLGTKKVASLQNILKDMIKLNSR